jgi:hypothetical protein
VFCLWVERLKYLFSLTPPTPTMVPHVCPLAPAGLRKAARVMADEQRAKHNINMAINDGNSLMDYGLDLWGKCQLDHHCVQSL